MILVFVLLLDPPSLLQNPLISPQIAVNVAQVYKLWFLWSPLREDNFSDYLHTVEDSVLVEIVIGVHARPSTMSLPLRGWRVDTVLSFLVAAHLIIITHGVRVWTTTSSRSESTHSLSICSVDLHHCVYERVSGKDIDWKKDDYEKIKYCNMN